MLELTLYYMDKEVEEIKKSISDLEEKFDSIVTDVEDLFACLVAQRANKKSIEEVVERAVIQHFNITLKEFYGVHYVKEGRPRKDNSPSQDVIEARKWGISIIRNILLKSPWTLGLVYPFYNHIIEIRHRKFFDGAIIPKTDEDRANREVLLAITTRIKKICKEEGLLDDVFQYI